MIQKLLGVGLFAMGTVMLVGACFRPAWECMPGECSEGQECRAVGLRSPVCVTPCDVSLDCGAGFACREGSCLPYEASCTQHYHCLGEFFCDSEQGTCEKYPAGESTCTDGVLGAGEADRDCGGGCSEKCALGRRCLEGGDCASAYCDSSGACALPPAAAARRWYVDADSTADPQSATHGLSWAEAFPTLQAAIAVLQPGDEVWVAEGTYYPDQGPGLTLGDKTKSFSLPPDVRLHGGFVGNETTLEARDHRTHPTVLSGDIGVSGDDSDNSTRIVHIANAGDRLLLSGFIITKARGTFGGGMFVGAGKARIEWTVFVDNSATATGGAVYANGGHPEFRWVSFLGNRADAGGAVAVRRSSAWLDTCFLSGNEALTNGGAVNAWNGASVRIDFSTLAANSAPTASVAIVITGAVVKIAGSIVYEATPTADAVALETCPTQPCQVAAVTINFGCLSAADITSANIGWSSFNCNPEFVNLPGPDGVVGTQDDSPEITSTSPARDFLATAGEGLPNLDILGRSRLVGGAVDLGCYEYAD